LRIGVLASGAGTNLQAILDRLHGRGAIDVVGVASDKLDAPALARAEAAGVETRSFPREAYPSRAERDDAMADWLQARGAELVVSAGYMQLLTPGFLARFPRRVVNVHPALLPAFPGLRAIEQAVERGVKVFGVTVHLIDEGVDSGPIIAQRAVELYGLPDADEVHEALQPLEHDLLCEVVEAAAAGALEPDPSDPRRIAYRPARMRGSA
jgi:phosphoribosylglycinamide formyltransferase 1